MNKFFSHPSFRPLIVLALSAILLGVFFKLTSEYREGEAATLDHIIAARVIGHRSPPLTTLFKAWTAFGSDQVLIGFLITGLLFLGVKRDWKGSTLLIASGVGASVLIHVFKNHISRPRPENALIHAGGFSYPSGHALGSTSIFIFLAFIIGWHNHKARIRLALTAFALLLIAGICLSRVYLGAHYPSDVLSGFFLGAGWSLLLAAYYLHSRRVKARLDS